VTTSLDGAPAAVAVFEPNNSARMGVGCSAVAFCAAIVAMLLLREVSWGK
jgi:hypothetical protein